MDYKINIYDFNESELYINTGILKHINSNLILKIDYEKGEFYIFVQKYNKKKKLIDISKELDIPEGTIRSWKNRYNWDDKDNATLQNNKTNNCNVANCKRKSKRINKEPIADEVKSLMKDEELSEKHRLFCVIYSKCMNATKAYQRVYHCAYWTAAVNGNALLKNTKIKNAINMMVESDLNKEFLKPGLIQRYKDIAFSDINEMLEENNTRFVYEHMLFREFHPAIYELMEQYGIV